MCVYAVVPYEEQAEENILLIFLRMKSRALLILRGKWIPRRPLVMIMSS